MTTSEKRERHVKLKKNMKKRKKTLSTGVVR